MSQVFASGGQSIEVSASASVLPMNTPGLISFRMDWLDLLAVQGTLKSLLQHHSSKASILLCSAIFIVGNKRKCTHSCPTLCDPMDYSLPGSSIHAIFQARVLEWVAIFFSRVYSWPRDWTQVSCIVSKTLYCLYSRDRYKITLSWEGQPYLLHMLPPYSSDSTSEFLFWVLVFYCCVTNYQKPNGFKQLKKWFPCILGNQKSKIKVLERELEALGEFYFLTFSSF